MYELFLLLATCTATLAERDGYTVCYDTAHKRPLWTIHQPQPSAIPTPRKHWRKDQELDSLPAKAFTNSGFDRGHLAPAADLPESQDSFLTSNAVPQIPALNRGAWRALENKIRKLRPTRVLTGAVYANCGNEQLEAPCFLYKLVILEDGQILADYAKNAPPRPQLPCCSAYAARINSLGSKPSTISRISPIVFRGVLLLAISPAEHAGPCFTTWVWYHASVYPGVRLSHFSRRSGLPYLHLRLNRSDFRSSKEAHENRNQVGCLDKNT